MYASLVANLDHAPQRLIESGSDSLNYLVLGLVGNVGCVEMSESP
jgi:hypothetical protein